MDKAQINENLNKRIKKFCQAMQEENIDIAVFRDSEDERNPAVRYFSKMPSDAILAIKSDGNTILTAWDINLANKIDAYAGKILPYTSGRAEPAEATKNLVKKLGAKENDRIEINTTTSYPDFLEYVDNIQEYDILCRKEGCHSFVTKMRAVKDEYEIECTKRAAEITNEIIEIIIESVKNGTIKTESDAALLIEKECRKRGCERTSFETLAAGPGRSWAIHAFPNYTDAPFATEGLSILDFGVCYEGYASDVTLTFARGPLSEKQELMLSLVQKAADEAIEFYKPGIPVRQASLKVDKIFAAHKMKLPHSLGHGTGLEIHEEPFVRSRASLEDVFEPGNIVTLEPGLYESDAGGVRLENDVLITETGYEVLTKSRIVRL